MTKSRLESFSDGIMATVITVIILNISIPTQDDLSAFVGIIDQVVIYIISFSIIGIYWVNHHSIFQSISKINNKILWRNIIFLFFLTMLPLTTEWVGKNFFSLVPQMTYGFVILAIDIAILCLLRQVCLSENRKESYQKNYYSLLLNVIALSLGYFIAPVLVCVVNFGMLAIWIIPKKQAL